VKEEQTGNFTYYMKVIAEGGEVAWTTEKLLECRCGENSA